MVACVDVDKPRLFVVVQRVLSDTDGNHGVLYQDYTLVVCTAMGICDLGCSFSITVIKHNFRITHYSYIFQPF